MANSTSYMLKIFIEDPELKEAYVSHIQAHVNRLTEQGQYADSGFDLLVPHDINPEANQNPIKIDMEISCAIFRKDLIGDYEPCAFYLYPRSSLYRTNLRLTNSVGIIDSGYRGHLAGVFDVVKPTSISKYSRLLQICTPDLRPIIDIRLVDTIDELGETTRGGGGFGSTGV